MSNLPEDSEGNRIASLEQDLGAINKKTDKVVGSGGKGDKEPCVQMTLSLFHRRKTMLIAHYSNNLNPRALEILADRFNTTPDTLQRDWERRSIWEPFIWANYAANDDGKKVLNQLQLARETALDIMSNPRMGGNARVGAIGRFTESIKLEIELKQSLGDLPKRLDPAVIIPLQQSLTQVNSETKVNLIFDLSRVSEDDKRAILRAEEALTRAETAAGPQ
jgi:hypothetical protein